MIHAPPCPAAKCVKEQYGVYSIRGTSFFNRCKTHDMPWMPDFGCCEKFNPTDCRCVKEAA